MKEHENKMSLKEMIKELDTVAGMLMFHCGDNPILKEAYNTVLNVSSRLNEYVEEE